MYSRRTVPQLMEVNLPYAAVFSSPRVTNLLKILASPRGWNANSSKNARKPRVFPSRKAREYDRCHDLQRNYVPLI